MKFRKPNSVHALHYYKSQNTKRIINREIFYLKTILMMYHDVSNLSSLAIIFIRMYDVLLGQDGGYKEV